MDTKLWGPAAWRFLHSLPWLPEYSERRLSSGQRQRVEEFFHALAEVLPCIYCRHSTRWFLQHYPIRPYTRNRVLLAQYIAMLHNLVNVKLDKQVEKHIGTAIEAAGNDAEEFLNGLFDFLILTARNYQGQDGGPPTAKRREDYKHFLQLLPQVLGRDNPYTVASRELESRVSLTEALASRASLLDWLQRLRYRAETASMA